MGGEGGGGGYQKWFLELPRAKARQLKIGLTQKYAINKQSTIFFQSS